MKKIKTKARGWGKISLVLLIAGLLALGVFAAGCGGEKAKPAPDENNPLVSANPQETPVKVTLYFSDSQAQKLMPEEREIIKKGESIEEAVIKELIKGPAKEGLLKTIPESTRLLSLSVVDGVAYVNFSKEIQTKHWGGSSGEGNTIYSVTNTLAQFEGIKKVQFLVEGKKVESLLGHMDTSVPVEPKMDMVGK